MRHTGIILLAACVLLAAASVAGSLAQAASEVGGDYSGVLGPAATPTPSFFVYLPLVVRDSGSASWVTITEEGFEAPPGNLWDFWDFDGTTKGSYYWARRDCASYTGSYSAWAVGGGLDGTSLSCGSDYPADVDSWMTYGPFSLAGATAAELRFRFWLYRGDAYDRDEFCWSAGSNSAELQANELCLTYDTGAWSPMTLDLGDPNALNLLGRPEVWIAFRFTSYGSGSQAEGAYVDDVVLRECVGGVCPAAARPGDEPSLARMRKVQAAVARPDVQHPAHRR
jgi:hypothetical protein